MKVGDEICDMHYGGTFQGIKEKGRRSSVDNLMLAEKYNVFVLNGKSYVFRNCVEWEDHPADNSNNTFGKYLQSAMRSAGGSGQYCNKILVVIGRVLKLNVEHDWFTAGYSYDGRRCGVCEIREV